MVDGWSEKRTLLRTLIEPAELAVWGFNPLGFCLGRKIHVYGDNYCIIHMQLLWTAAGASNCLTDGIFRIRSGCNEKTSEKAVWKLGNSFCTG